MAGFSRILVIGGLGGHVGADGVNPIQLQIWVGEGGRRWFEAHYFDPTLKPLGAIKTVVPAGPDDPNGLLDACLAFYPDYFSACPSMAAVSAQLAHAERLDFDLGRNGIPKEWAQLRGEAAPLMRSLPVFVADLKPVSRSDA